MCARFFPGFEAHYTDSPSMCQTPTSFLVMGERWCHLSQRFSCRSHTVCTAPWRAPNEGSHRQLASSAWLGSVMGWRLVQFTCERVAAYHIPPYNLASTVNTELQYEMQTCIRLRNTRCEKLSRARRGYTLFAY